MHLPPPTLPPGRPDPKWLRRQLLVQRVVLALVLLLSLATLSVWQFPPIAGYMPFLAHSNIAMAFAAMFCALSLIIAEPGNPKWVIAIGQILALLPAAFTTGILVASTLPQMGAPGTAVESLQQAFTTDNLSLLPVSVLLLLSVVMTLVHSERTWLRRASDLLVALLCLLTLILVSQDVFGAFGFFHLNAADLISFQFLGYAVLFTLVVALRQAEYGAFRIFLGDGIGSRIARVVAPILVLWPFLREIGESQIIEHHLIPSHFAPSILTSLAAAVFMVFLLALVWRINSMEQEIHDLTLRDDLTGLYNMRGFYLLAEQTLRLAKRAKMPFSVLFIDLDGLKQINDQLGHRTGSEYLVETGELVSSCFREGDVKGRFGGDEFVVAGQFSIAGIQIAVQRLEAAVARKNERSTRPFPLSFSVGHVTTDYYSTETLEQMVSKADEAMYEQKKHKKTSRL